MKMTNSKLIIAITYLLLVASVLAMAALFVSDPPRWISFSHAQSWFLWDDVYSPLDWQDWRVLLIAEAVVTAIALTLLLTSGDDGAGKICACGWCITWPVVFVIFSICRAISLFITWSAESGAHYFLGELMLLYFLTAAAMLIAQMVTLFLSVLITVGDAMGDAM